MSGYTPSSNWQKLLSNPDIKKANAPPVKAKFAARAAHRRNATSAEAISSAPSTNKRRGGDAEASGLPSKKTKPSVGVSSAGDPKTQAKVQKQLKRSQQKEARREAAVQRALAAAQAAAAAATASLSETETPEAEAEPTGDVNVATDSESQRFSADRKHQLAILESVLPKAKSATATSAAASAPGAATALSDILDDLDAAAVDAVQKESPSVARLIELARTPAVRAEHDLFLYGPGPTKPQHCRAGRFVAMDCEMVGVGPEGERSVLARVSIVNFYGHVLLDTLVAPTEPVTDYRTHVTGITRQMLVGAPSFKEVQYQVASLLKDKVVVGHSIHNDFKVLFFTHPKGCVRDTSTWYPYRRLAQGPPSLRQLSAELLGIQIQTGAHSSVVDARAAMLLYHKQRASWELKFRGRENMRHAKASRHPQLPKPKR